MHTHSQVKQVSQMTTIQLRDRIYWGKSSQDHFDNTRDVDNLDRKWKLTHQINKHGIAQQGLHPTQLTIWMHLQLYGYMYDFNSNAHI